MSEARKKILSMLAEGKISVDESEELLSGNATKKILGLLSEGKITVDESEELLGGLGPKPQPQPEPTPQTDGDPKQPFGVNIGSMAKNMAESFRDAFKKVEPPSKELKSRLKEFGGWMQNVVGSLANEFSHIRGEPLDGMHVDFTVAAPEGLESVNICVIENLFGDVTINEGPEFSLHVMGRISKAALEGQPPNLWFNGNALRVENETLTIGIDRKSPTKAVLNMEMTLPKGMILRGKSVSSSYKVKGNFVLEDLQTVSGAINLCEVDLREATIDTVSGDIRIEGGSLDANIKGTNGEYMMKNCTIGKLRLQAVNGHLLMTECTISEETSVEVITTSGDLTVEKLTGPWSSVEATSRTGDTTVKWEGTMTTTPRQGTQVESGQAGAEFKAETVSGDILFD